MDPIAVLCAVRSSHATEELVASTIPNLGEHPVSLWGMAKRKVDRASGTVTLS